MKKASQAFRSISEVASELNVPKHVLRFWETKFPQIKPMKRGGGRRFYRPEDLQLLRGIQCLLHSDGYTIKGVQKILREQGVEHVKDNASGQSTPAELGKQAGQRKGSSKNKETLSDPVQRTKTQTVAPLVANNADAKPASDVREMVDRMINELEACHDLLIDQQDAMGSEQEGSALKRRRAAAR